MKQSNKYLMIGVLWSQFEIGKITLTKDPIIFERLVNDYIAAHEESVKKGFCPDNIPQTFVSDFESHVENNGF